MAKKYFLFTTGEGGDTSVNAYSSYLSAYRAMKTDYDNYSFDTEECGEGTCWTARKEAYVDSPYDGWQRHWFIKSLDELLELKVVG